MAPALALHRDGEPDRCVGDELGVGSELLAWWWLPIGGDGVTP
jgi:hypothetical protein